MYQEDITDLKWKTEQQVIQLCGITSIRALKKGHVQPYVNPLPPRSNL